jgi:hypothetical protein
MTKPATGVTRIHTQPAAMLRYVAYTYSMCSKLDRWANLTTTMSFFFLSLSFFCYIITGNFLAAEYVLHGAFHALLRRHQGMHHTAFIRDK